MMMVMMMLSIMMIWWMVDSGRMYGGEVDAKMHWARYYLILSGLPNGKALNNHLQNIA